MPSNKEAERKAAMAKRAAEIEAFKAQFAPDAVGVENQARNAADTLYGNGRPEVTYSQEMSPFEASQAQAQAQAQAQGVIGRGQGVQPVNPDLIEMGPPPVADKPKSEQLLAQGPAAQNPAILAPNTSMPAPGPGEVASAPVNSAVAQAQQMANALTTEQPAKVTNPNQPSGSPPQSGSPSGSPSGSEASSSGASGSVKTEAGSPELLAKYDTYRQAADEQMMGMYAQEANGRARQLEDRNNNGIPDAEEEAGDISRIMDEHAAALKDAERMTAERLLANNRELKARKTQYMQQMQRNLEYLANNPINPMAVAGSGAGMAGMAGAAFFDTYYALKGWKVPSMTKAWDDAIARNLEAQKALMDAGKETGEGFKQLWSMAVSAADTEKDAIENMKAMYATSLMASQLRELAPYKAAAAQRDRAEITAKIYGELGNRYMAVANHFKQAYDSEWKIYESKEKLALAREKAKLGQRASARAGAAGAYRANAKAENVSSVVSPHILEALGWKDEKGNLDVPVVISKPVMEADGRMVMRPTLMLRKGPTTEGMRKTLNEYSAAMITKQNFITHLGRISGPKELATAWRQRDFKGIAGALSKRINVGDTKAANDLRAELGMFLADYVKKISGAAVTDNEFTRHMANLKIPGDANSIREFITDPDTSPDKIAGLMMAAMATVDAMGQADERLMLSGSFGEAYAVPKARKAPNEMNAVRDNMIFDELTQDRFAKDAPEHNEAYNAAAVMGKAEAKGVPGVVKYKTAGDATLELQKQRIEDALKNPPFGLNEKDVRDLIPYVNSTDPTGLSPAQLEFLSYIRKPAQGAPYIDTKPLLAGLAKYRKERNEGRPGDEVLAEVKESAAQIGNTYAINYTGTSKWPEVYGQIKKELGGMLTTASKQALEALNQEVAAEPDLARGQAILKARLKAIVDYEVDLHTSIEDFTPTGIAKFLAGKFKEKAGANK